MTRAPAIKRSHRQSQLSELIGQIYDAAQDETLWPGLGPAIARAFESTSTALRLRDRRTGEGPLLAWTENMKPSEAAMEQYQLYHWWRDIFFHRGRQMGMSQVYLRRDLISDRDLERTEFYFERLSKIGVFDMVGTVFPVADGVISSLGIHRDRAEGGYEEKHRLSVAAFLPHLSRALQLRSRLLGRAVEREATLGVLQRTGVATFVIGRDSRLIYANARAEALLRDGDGISAAGGRLITWNQADGNRLARAIENAIAVATNGDGPPGDALAILRSDRLPLTALVAPFRTARNGLGAPVPAAILFIRDPENHRLSRLALESLYGLTATEATLAAALAEGMSADTIAATHRVSLNTVRTHLKNIMAKTGTNRQAELVVLIHQSIAALDSR